MTSAPSPPAAPPALVTLRGPADILAALPYVLGYRPAASVVLVSLRGQRGRVGLSLRADLPASEDVATVCAELVAHLVRDGATEAIAAVYGDPDPLLWPELRRVLDAAALPLREALRVTDGRWWSYLCSDRSCCPTDGTPIRSAADPDGPTLVTATMVGAGLAALDSRQALADTIRAPSRDAALAMQRLLERVAEATARRLVRPGGLASCRREWQRDVVARLQGALAVPPPTLPDEQVAALLVALADVPTRDVAAGWVEGARGDAARGLWAELTRRAPRPYDVAPATLLANAAWRDGQGALARIAVERALTSDPSYRLALLLQRVLDDGINPAAMRRRPPRGRGRRRR